MTDAIFDEIRDERRVQDRQWGGPAHDDARTRSEWVALLARHVGLAVDDGEPDVSDRFRKQMVRVAALAVAALEAHGRKCPPERLLPRFPCVSDGTKQPWE